MCTYADCCSSETKAVICTPIPKLDKGLMNHILCSIGRMHFNVYSVKCLNAKTLQQLLEGSKLDEGRVYYNLGNVFVEFS